MTAIALQRAAQGPSLPSGRERRARDGGGPWNDHVRGILRERYPQGSGKLPRRGWDATSGEALISTAEQSAESCVPTLTLLACGCRVRVTRLGCNRTACVECAGVVGQRRGRRVASKLRATLEAVRARAPGVRDPRMWSLHRIVFTIPPAYRDRFASPLELADLRRRLAELLVGKAAGGGRRRGGLGWAGCVIIPHPVGDKDPTRFHPHLNVFAWRDRWGRGVLSADELAAVREGWRELLGMGDEAGPVNVNVRFMRQDEDRKIEFSCRYMARIFAGWGGWSPKWIQWFGKVEKTPEEDDTCEHCGERLRQIATGAEAELRWRELRAHRPTGPPLELVPAVPGDVVDVPFAELDPAWWAEHRSRILSTLESSAIVRVNAVEQLQAAQGELELRGGAA